MIRFLTYLFGGSYEPCKSCETLKQQLEIVNIERQDLLNTIMSLVKPEVIQSNTRPTVVMPAIKKAVPWAEKRRILEAEDRARAALQAKQSSPVLNTKIEAVEKELGIAEQEVRDAIS